MDTEDKIKLKIKQLKEQRSLLNQQIAENEQMLADMLSLFKVGQRVFNRGSEYEITEVRLWFNDSTLIYKARKVLKSGELHKNAVQLFGGISLDK